MTRRTAEISLGTIYSPDQTLICPRCGGDYLHQREVIVYDRNEDDEQCTVSSVKDGRVSSHLIATKENPSSRRQGLRLRFDCEGCAGPLDLCIAQHKGITELRREFEKEDEPLEP